MRDRNALQQQRKDYKKTANIPIAISRKEAKFGLTNNVLVICIT